MFFNYRNIGGNTCKTPMLWWFNHVSKGWNGNPTSSKTLAAGQTGSTGMAFSVYSTGVDCSTLHGPQEGYMEVRIDPTNSGSKKYPVTVNCP